VLGSALFLVTLFVLKRDIRRIEFIKKDSDRVLLENEDQPEKSNTMRDNEAFSRKSKESDSTENF